jgi:hypothetical protein
MEGVRGSNPLSSTQLKGRFRSRDRPFLIFWQQQTAATVRRASPGRRSRKTCSGRWRGVVSLGVDSGGKRLRKKVSGQTRTEVKDKLKALHSELDAGVRTAAGYTVDTAVTDWLAEGLPGRAAKTVEVYRDALRPVLAVIGRIPLRDLSVQDVRTALAKMAVTHSTPTLQKAHNCLTWALRHAEGRDLVRRNVSALVDTPHGRQGWTRRRSRCGGQSAPTATPRRTDPGGRCGSRRSPSKSCRHSCCVRIRSG